MTGGLVKTPTDHRPSGWDSVFMDMAITLSRQSTCARRQVGCILVRADNTIASTGFNGVPPKWPHCRPDKRDPGREEPCPGADSPSGTNIGRCFANHAEANALINCVDPRNILTCYCTTSPCLACVKLLLCTSLTRIVFLENYADCGESRNLWQRAHRVWVPLGLR